MRQKNTTEREVSVSGVGIHSGKHVHLCLRPSQSGEIVFQRSDLKDRKLRLNSRKFEGKNRAILSSGKHRVQTIEHLMACLFMFRIDSLLVMLDGDEVPVMDGSALPFVELLRKAGSRPLDEKIRSLKIISPFQVEGHDAFIAVEPDENFRITYTIDYNHPAIQKQTLGLVVDKQSFVRQIAPARTFGFLKDVPSLRAQNMALGGSLNNALVLDESELINGPLRFSDEYVRHKILDFIGDLSLQIHPFMGHFTAHKAGHSLHLKFMNFLLENQEHWEYL